MIVGSKVGVVIVSGYGVCCVGFNDGYCFVVKVVKRKDIFVVFE